MLCYCCSNKNFSDCCEPIIEKKFSAKTPEELMRSRYSAYASGNLQHIKKTMSGKAKKWFDLQASEDWIDNNEWKSLEIIDVSETDDEGEVEFIATYNYLGEEHKLHERSVFSKINGEWFYVDKKSLTKQAISNKIGRNEPCSCNSGKKYKKCCGK